MRENLGNTQVSGYLKRISLILLKLGDIVKYYQYVFCTFFLKDVGRFSEARRQAQTSEGGRYAEIYKGFFKIE